MKIYIVFEQEICLVKEKNDVQQICIRHAKCGSEQYEPTL